LKDPGFPSLAGRASAAVGIQHPEAPTPKLSSREFGARATERGVRVDQPLARPIASLAPSVPGVRREFLRRLGIRREDLSAAGGEAVDLYSRATSKLRAIDKHFETHPVVDADGTPSPALTAYWTGLNTAARLLGRVLEAVEQMAREDSRYDDAVQALIAEGRSTRAGRADDPGV
jgi:hypothetical protein